MKTRIRILIMSGLLIGAPACATPAGKVSPADWSAPDPTLDTLKQYRPVFKVSIQPEDYPPVLREERVSPITVYCTMLVRADGKIQDVKVRRMHSRSNDHGPFRRVITRMARDVVLNKTKLISEPYRVDGKPSPFIWETQLEFTP